VFQYKNDICIYDLRIMKKFGESTSFFTQRYSTQHKGKSEYN